MSEQAIRAKIAERILTVTGVEKVYDYPVAVTDWEQFIAQFKDSTGKICGFEVMRESAQDKYDDTQEAARTHNMLVRGYMGLSNSTASHNAFQALLDAVCDKFRFDHYLSGVAGQITNITPMQIRRSDERIFGSVLCHYAELTIAVSELITT